MLKIIRLKGRRNVLVAAGSDSIIAKLFRAISGDGQHRNTGGRQGSSGAAGGYDLEATVDQVAAVADQQVLPQFHFKLPHLPAERGLCYPQRVGRLAEAAEFGNVTELGDAGGSPGKSSLFFLTVYHPEIGLSGARV